MSGGFLFYMTIFIRADESGVFDPIHNDFFIFAGLIFLNRQEMELTGRRFLSIEKKLRQKKEYKNIPELKAALLKHSDRRTLFSVTESCNRFASVINLKKIDRKAVLADKKSKQRYLDYAFELGLKRAVQCMAAKGSISFDDPAEFDIILDERTSATNGEYNLAESILHEMRGEICNINTLMTFAPVLPAAKKVSVRYGNSAKEPLLRAADVLANRILHECRHGNICNLMGKNNLFTLSLP